MVVMKYCALIYLTQENEQQQPREEEQANQPQFYPSN